jgi:DNA-binding NarL/FixJ family response regulator
VSEGPTTNEPIKVLIADDHAMFRQGVSEMLQTDDRIEVVGEAENGRQAVALAERLRPDVVLLDVEMPLMGARQVMERMLDNPPAPRVIVVTMHDEPRLVRELIGMGASAYLVKSATMEQLHEAVHNAARSPMGPDEGVVVVAPRGLLEEREGPDGVSGRELEVLLLVASLHISEATVKRHLANLYPKIGVSSRGEAVRIALSKGWIGPYEMIDAPDPT